MTVDPIGTTLADGSCPATPGDVFRRFDELGIETRTVEHPPVFTVEEAKRLRGQIPGCHTKNLFLRDKKGAMWLVVCLEDRDVDLRRLAQQLGTGRLSFGSANRLMKFLGVTPGAVTPFAVVNDTQAVVRVALDADIVRQASLNFHPLDNRMTTAIGSRDLVSFLEACRHPAKLIDFT